MTYYNQECLEKTAASFTEAMQDAFALSPMCEIKNNTSPWHLAAGSTRLLAQCGWGENGPRNVMVNADSVHIEGGSREAFFEYGRPRPSQHLGDTFRSVKVSFSKRIPTTRYQWELGIAAHPGDEENPPRPGREAYARGHESAITIESGVMWRGPALRDWTEDAAQDCMNSIAEAPEDLKEQVRKHLDLVTKYHAKWHAMRKAELQDLEA